MFRPGAWRVAGFAPRSRLHRPGHGFGLRVPLASFAGLAGPAETAFSIKWGIERLNLRATLAAGESFRCPACRDMGEQKARDSA